MNMELPKKEMTLPLTLPLNLPKNLPKNSGYQGTQRVLLKIQKTT